MTRDQALAKIKKCLALSRSSNEHEAAAGLRQAQALMREYSIETGDAELAHVAEFPARARFTAINQWESQLASCVAGAFGCQHFSLKTTKFIGGRMHTHRDVVFVGIDTAPQVAGYAYDVLSRQCAKARLAHIQRQPKSCKPITRTARGDQFAWGWVFAVRELVQQFAGDPEDVALISSYIESKHPELQTVTPRNTTVGRNTRDADLEAGFSAGRTAQLNHGLAGAAAVPRLG
jgi:hypothetical protein